MTTGELTLSSDSVVSDDDWEISSADLGIKAGVTYRF